VNSRVFAAVGDRPVRHAGQSAAGNPVYSCFDFRLASDLPLDDLALANPGDRRPVVTVRAGPVRERLPDSKEEIDGLQIAGPVALLTIPGVARFLLDRGREIVVDPHPGVSERKLRLFLLGSALGILCHQRGLLPLHANAIVTGRGAVAFAGPSGAGKSTLAAEFQRRGYRLLADDVCMVDFAENGAPVALPGIPRVKLCADAATRFGLDCSLLDPVSEDTAKYHVPTEGLALTQGVPFRRLYVMSRADGDRPGDIVRLQGEQAMAALMAHTYRGFCLAPMGLHERHFRHCAAMLRSVRVYAAARQWGFDHFDREVDRLERHLGEDDPA